MGFPQPMRGTRILVSGIGRLKPGLTLAQAQARLTAMAAELRHDFPTDYPPQAQWAIEIQPLQETLVGEPQPANRVCQRQRRQQSRPGSGKP
jgi:hypothetical protein